MGPVIPRILSSELHTHPFPYFASDNVVSSAYLDEIKSNWPALEKFTKTDGYGYYVLPIDAPHLLQNLQPAQSVFWEEFSNNAMLQIVYGSLAKYAEFIFDRYGPELDRVEIVNLFLCESDDEFYAAGAHNHSHDPTWLFTNLVYINDGGSSIRGSQLYDFDGDIPNTESPLLDVLAGTPCGNRPDGLSPARYIDFVPGRMISFFETPFSYHGSEPVTKEDLVKQGPARKPRRMIRMHVRAPLEFCEKFYNIGIDEYRPKKLSGEANATTIGWLRDDLSCYQRSLEKSSSDLSPGMLDYISSLDIKWVTGRERDISRYRDL